jgi:hypothetical protein
MRLLLPCLLLVPGLAGAQESGGPSLSITETFLLERHGFNQDGRADNDDYEDVKSRLNLSLSDGAYTGTLRMDNIIYISPPNDTYVDDHRIERIALRVDSGLATVTAGDFYVQFGRGIALALRKIDELGVDTALRGARVDVHLPEWETTLIAGTTNIVNVDEVNRRLVPDPGDQIVGGRTETTIENAVTVGTHAVVMVPAVPGRTGHDRIGNFGLDVAIPELPGGFSLVVEGDLQWRRIGNVDPGEGDSAHRPAAFYGDLSWSAGPLSLTAEVKDYYDFAPLEGGNDPFSGLPYTYTQPPTAERTDQQVPTSRNIIGGRLRGDLRIPGTSHAVFVNYAQSRTRSRNLDAGGYELEDDVIHQHGYVGAELRLNGDRTITQVSGGIRTEDDAQDDHNLRRLVHGELDLTTPLFGPWGLHLSWVHESWRQKNPVASRGDILYNRGTAVVELDWGSDAAGAVGFEYDTEAQLEGIRKVFWFGDVRWNASQNITLHGIVGTQRGGLKCVNGVCRTFPPFAGARAEVVVRY